MAKKPVKPKKERRPGNRAFVNKLDREAAKTEAVKWLRRGVPGYAVAEKLKVDPCIISRWKKEAFQRLVEERLDDRQAMIEEQCAIQQEVRLMALKAWYRSMKPKERTTEEWIPLRQDKEAKPGEEKEAKKSGPPKQASLKDTLRLLKAINLREGRLPAVEYLNTIIRTSEVEAKLRGLFLEINVDAQQHIHVSWDEMRSRTKPQDPMLELEAELISSKPSKQPSTNGVHKKEQDE